MTRIRVVTLVACLGVGSCSADALARVLSTAQVERRWDEDVPERGSVAMSVRPLAALAPPERVIIVEEPPDSTISLGWPVRVGEPERREPSKWWETQAGVVGTATAVAGAVLAIWQRKRIAGAVRSARRRASKP